VVTAFVTFNLDLYCEMKFIVVCFEVNKEFKDRIYLVICVFYHRL
jgi:hypothetical protein